MVDIGLPVDKIEEAVLAAWKHIEETGPPPAHGGSLRPLMAASAVATVIDTLQRREYPSRPPKPLSIWRVCEFAGDVRVMNGRWEYRPCDWLNKQWAHVNGVPEAGCVFPSGCAKCPIPTFVAALRATKRANELVAEAAELKDEGLPVGLDGLMRLTGAITKAQELLAAALEYAEDNERGAV